MQGLVFIVLQIRVPQKTEPEAEYVRSVGFYSR
jgi:hypothetical protein